MIDSSLSWLCFQLGAREHYAVPRALQISGLLSKFITDLWIRPGTFKHPWIKRLSGRFHPGLADARISATNLAALTFELKACATGTTGWKLITQRNEWFQHQALAQLAGVSTKETHTVFAYSYAAEKILRFARRRGWRTVLGQVDPGPTEERIVAALHEESGLGQGNWEPAPAEYWERWRTECELADQIVVNSVWSRNALLTEGVPAEKVRIVPLAYESDSQLFHRHYPQHFNAARPLRILFLGQINLRKGVRQLLEAANLLAGENVEFWFVGPAEIEIPKHPALKWFGAVPRAQVDRYYRNADVFILPTLSDGFGLTQLEAQSWKLPVITSRYCGEVVRDGVNGIILEEVSGKAIADVLLKFLRSTDSLNAMSAQSGVEDRFSLKTLATSLKSL